MRPGAVPYYVVVTRNGRQTVDGFLSFASLNDELQNKGAVLDVVVDARFATPTGTEALGVDALGRAIVADGNGGYELVPGGEFISGSGETDYIDLAWAVGGTAWDLDLVRTDSGQVAMQAFVDRAIQQVQGRQASPIPRLSRPIRMCPLKT